MKVMILKFMNKLQVLFFVYIVFLGFLFSQDNLEDFVVDSNFLNSEPVLVDGIYAVVGSHVIFHSDINNQMLQYQTQGIQYDNNISLRQKVIDELFFTKLLLHSAALDSIEIDESEIDNNINQRIAFFEQQFGSKESIEQYFQKSMNELILELKPIIRDQLLTQKMQYEITKNITVSPSEVSDFYNQLDIDSIPVIEAQFQIAHILKTPDAENTSIEETLSKLEDLRNRILNGADFATMAILYSEDPGSSRNGGSYYNVKKGFFVKEFEAVAFSLNPGEISEIFQTEFGYHIVELIERRGNELDVRHILMTPKISNQDMLQAKEFLKKLKTDILDNEISFNEASEKFSSDKETRYNGGLLINPNTNNSFFLISDLENDPALLNEIRTMSPDDITEPIYMKLLNGKEAYRIIKLVSKKEAHIANLKEDYSFLHNYYSQIKQSNEMQDWYNENIQKVHIQLFNEM